MFLFIDSMLISNVLPKHNLIYGFWRIKELWRGAARTRLKGDEYYEFDITFPDIFTQLSVPISRIVDPRSRDVIDKFRKTAALFEVYF